MGFFNKIKSFKNAITGGAARVQLDTSDITFGEPFNVVVKVQVESADIQVEKVYLKIIGKEVIEIPDIDVTYESDGVKETDFEGKRVEKESARASSVTTTLDMTVTEAQVLKANENYEWSVSVELPSEALAIYKGKYCQHTYFARASLDCFGNDPDSGWVELEMK